MDEIKQAAMDLLKINPSIDGCNVEWMKARRGYREGDENFDLFTEAFLYVAFGKEGARTILARVAKLQRALGIEEY